MPGTAPGFILNSILFPINAVFEGVMIKNIFSFWLKFMVAKTVFRMFLPIIGLILLIVLLAAIF